MGWTALFFLGKRYIYICTSLCNVYTFRLKLDTRQYLSDTILYTRQYLSDTRQYISDTILDTRQYLSDTRHNLTISRQI